MNYRIAIPTYKRNETIKKATLNTLKNYKISPSVVDIFVNTKEEYDIYRRALQNEPFQNIIIGEKGIMNIRNFIARYYKKGDYVIGMDDDLYGLIEKNDKKVKPLADFEKLIQQGYDLMQKYKTGIWGVYPVNNGFFMKKEISLDLRYIIAFFYGMIIQGDDTDIVRCNHGEDFERSIKFYKRFGRVVRFNYISADTYCYTEDGGLQEFRNDENVMAGVQYVLKEYPLYCRFVADRKHPELRLVDKSLKDIRNAKKL